MKHLRIAMSSLMILAFDPLTAHAQTKPKPKLHIMIGELTEYNLKCGVRADTIKASATLVLRRNGIDVSSGVSFPFLFIYVDSMASMPNTDAVCVSFINVSIRYIQEGGKTNEFSVDKEYVILCERWGMLRSVKSDMNKPLSEQIEILLKSCLAEVEY